MRTGISPRPDRISKYVPIGVNVAALGLFSGFSHSEECKAETPNAAAALLPQNNPVISSGQTVQVTVTLHAQADMNVTVTLIYSAFQDGQSVPVSLFLYNPPPTYTVHTGDQSASFLLQTILIGPENDSIQITITPYFEGQHPHGTVNGEFTIVP